MVENRTDNPLTLKLGREELIIRRRYEVVSIINDFFIAIGESGHLAVYHWQLPVPDPPHHPAYQPHPR